MYDDAAIVSTWEQKLISGAERQTEYVTVVLRASLRWHCVRLHAAKSLRERP